MRRSCAWVCACWSKPLRTEPLQSPGLQLRTIGRIRTCFQEKFGVPRQPGLIPEARGVLQLANEPFLRQAIQGLEGFSHLWIIFGFHAHGARFWKPSVRPPRLGGARRVGVLATRSPHRPNPIGISAVRLERVEPQATGGAQLHLSGVDFLDGTPVYDIKPYLAYADSHADARLGWVPPDTRRQRVLFSVRAQEALEDATLLGSELEGPYVRSLIVGILGLDPRPPAQKKLLPPRAYGFRLFHLDVRWQHLGDHFQVEEVVALSPLAEDPPS